MLALFMALCGTVVTGISVWDSFTFLAASRVILGVLSAFFNPLSYSLLSEYFPDDKRATSNSILQSSNFVGWGLSSLSILLIRQLGWRKTYGFLGTLAFILSAVTLFLVKEPKRKLKSFFSKKEEAI